MKKLIPLFTLITIANLSIAQTNNDIIETIKVSGVAEVYFTQQPSEKIRKVVSGKPAPEVIVNYESGVLTVGTKGEAQNEVVKVYVSSPGLKNIIVGDAAQFHGLTILKTSSLSIESDDSGSVDLEVDVDTLNLLMKGGDITVSGKVDKQNIKRSGDHKRGTLRHGNLNITNSEKI